MKFNLLKNNVLCLTFGVISLTAVISVADIQHNNLNNLDQMNVVAAGDRSNFVQMYDIGSACSPWVASVASFFGSSYCKAN